MNRFVRAMVCIVPLGLVAFGCRSSTDIPSTTPSAEDGGGVDVVLSDPKCDKRARAEAYSACTASKDQPTCEQNGGEWKEMGSLRYPACFCDTGQGNCPCTSDLECLDGCRYPIEGPDYKDGCPKTWLCSNGYPYGCFCRFYDGAVKVTCTD